MAKLPNPPRTTQTARSSQRSRKTNSKEHGSANGQDKTYHSRSLKRKPAVSHTAAKKRTSTIKSAASKSEQNVRAPSKRRKSVPSKSPTNGLCSKLLKSKFNDFLINKEYEEAMRDAIQEISYNPKIMKTYKKCVPIGKAEQSVKVKSIENKSDVNIFSWDQHQWPVRDICTINCFQAFANLPSIECSYCYCLYHSECVPESKREIRPSLCKDCLLRKTEFFNYLTLQETPVETPNTEELYSIDPMVDPKLVSKPDVNKELTLTQVSQLQITPPITSKLAPAKEKIPSKTEIITELATVPTIKEDVCRAQDDPSKPGPSNKYFGREVCTVKCFDTFEQLPSEECSYCLCLFHSKCIPNLKQTKIQSLCKDCQSIETETAHNPNHQGTSLTTPNTSDPFCIDPEVLPKVVSIPDFDDKLRLVLETRVQLTSTISTLIYTKLHIPPNCKTEISTELVTVSPFTEDIC